MLKASRWLGSGLVDCRVRLLVHRPDHRPCWRGRRDRAGHIVRL